MRALKLEIESLAVESFSASPAENADRGRMSADCSVVCTFDWDCTA
jgi:hypothetical protein